jgi:glutathione S-transferase
MSTIRLWYSPGACSLAPHILLNEIAADFEAIKVPIKDGAHLTEAFIRLNPKKRLPVLALDEEVITELPAIATAISHLAPERHLMGKSALEAARVYEWMNWLSGTVHAQGFGCIWRPQRFSEDVSVHPAITAKGHITVGECYCMIEDKLSGARHAVGKSFTGVDAFLIVLYRWGHRIGLDMRKTYPNFSGLIAGLSERSSVKRTLATEDISLDGTR